MGLKLNKKRIDRSQKKSKSSGGGGFFRCKDGRNIVRIFPFSHKITKADIKAGHYKEGEGDVGDTYDEIDREVYRHFTEDGVINCLLKNCQYCGDADTYLESNKKADKKIGKQLQAKRAFYVNLIDIDDQEKGMQVGNLPASAYSVIIGYVNDPEFGEEVLGGKGRDFVIDYDKTLDPGKMYNVKIRDEKRCEELEGGIEDDIQDLFRVALLEPGWSSEDSLNESEGVQESDTEKVERKKEEKGSKSKKRSSKENDFEDEDRGKPEESSDGTKFPWEEDSFEVGEKLEFDEEGEVLIGKVVDIDEEAQEAGIKVGKDIFSIPFAELRRPARKRSSRKR